MPARDKLDLVEDWRRELMIRLPGWGTAAGLKVAGRKLHRPAGQATGAGC